MNYVDQLRTAFGTIDTSLLENLASSSEPRVLAAGDVLFRERDIADAMYVVVRGDLVVSIGCAAGPPTTVGHVASGETVGEMQIISGGMRTATVTAAAETELVRIPRAAVERLVGDNPGVVNHLAQAIRWRVRRNQLAAILPTLFGPFDEKMLHEIEAAVQWITLPRGGLLFDQGDPGDAVYILVNGRLQASMRNAQGVEKLFGEIQRGETVGEMALFTGEPRSARVRALRDSELVSLDRPAFERLIAKYPQTLMALIQIVIKRLHAAQRGPGAENGVRMVAVIAAGPDVPLESFTSRLAAALEQHGSTLRLTAPDVDRMCGTPGIARSHAGDDAATARIAALIDSEEIRHRFLLFQADADASMWSKRCVRYADRILIVARASDDPAPGAVERELLGADPATASVPTSLVLLHPEGTDLPLGTKRWIQPRRLVRHHHARMTQPGDIERVARFVAGRAFGIALSGGGARGFAHIGVLKALMEHGIPIDMIGGTSMGACIAAEYAVGWDSATMAQKNTEIFAKWHSDLTLPVVAILNGRRSTKRLRAVIGDVEIEDLWLPYFCVSSNLSRAEIMVHRDGPLWIALRASAGLPGVFPPLAYNGDLLVDGGFLRNLPADIMCELTGGGTTIAVDVSSELDMQYQHVYVDAISGWRLFWNRINPFTRTVVVPSIAAVIQRAGEIASVLMQREALLNGIDLYVRIPVQRFGLLDFASAREIIDTGYETARGALAGWLARKITSSPVTSGYTEDADSAGARGAAVEAEAAVLSAAALTRGETS